MTEEHLMNKLLELFHKSIIRKQVHPVLSPREQVKPVSYQPIKDAITISWKSNGEDYLSNQKRGLSSYEKGSVPKPQANNAFKAFITTQR